MESPHGSSAYHQTDYDIPREDETGNLERRSRSNLQNRVKNTIQMK